METAQAGMQAATPKLETKAAPTFDQPPSKEFLAELRYRARKFGWGSDYITIVGFVKALYAEAKLPAPNLEPFPVERKK